MPHRFFLPKPQTASDLLLLQDREAHHALHVVRVRTGDTVEILDGQGARLDCEVTEIRRHDVGLRVLRRRTDPPLPFQATLFQALPKPKAMDSIVQKAAELGVGRVVPLLTERVVTKPQDASSKSEKWTWIAIDALKQCGSAWLPHIEPPRPLAEALALPDTPELSLVASLESRVHVASAFASHLAAHGHPPRSVSAWIGPEGDFTADELRAIESAGARPVSLGSLVLRSDTAAIALLAILHHEMSRP